MSWSIALRRARAIFGAGAAAKPARVDAALPLSAAIGSAVWLSTSAFLRASGTLVPTPDRQLRVISISKLHVGIEGAVHRYIFARGDGGADAHECFLQVHTDTVGEVTELVYFARLLRLFPTTAQEQSAYLGEDGQGLGEATFALARSQLEELHLPKHVLDAAFKSEEAGAELTYHRAVEARDVPFVAPFRGTENRVDDSKGGAGLRQEVVFMPYERSLGADGCEQLLICTEILQDQNFQPRREIHVDFMVGLVLSPADVSVA